MFATIRDSIYNDPVKEITKKLNNKNSDGRNIFNNQTDYSKTNLNRVNRDQINSNQINQYFDNRTKSDFDDNYTGSQNNGSEINILTDNNSLLNLASDAADFGGYAPFNYNDNTHSFINTDEDHLSYNRNRNTDIPEKYTKSRCNYSINHLEQCDNCYNKMNRLIETKVNKKFDELMLQEKIKQLENSLDAKNSKNYNKKSSESWKDTMIIILGAVIVIFMIFLIVRSLSG